jgi:hypothetical protein
MRAEQTVNEMAEEVLARQAKTLAQRSGEPLVEALECDGALKAQDRFLPSF